MSWSPGSSECDLRLLLLELKGPPCAAVLPGELRLVSLSLMALHLTHLPLSFLCQWTSGMVADSARTLGRLGPCAWLGSRHFSCVHHGILREESVPLLGLTALLWLLGLGLNPPGCCRVDSEARLGGGSGDGSGGQPLGISRTEAGGGGI